MPSKTCDPLTMDATAHAVPARCLTQWQTNAVFLEIEGPDTPRLPLPFPPKTPEKKPENGRKSTEMTNELPGLEHLRPGTNGGMVKAVQKTIDAKRAAGLLQPEHEAYCQLALTLAVAIDAGAASAKTSVPQSAQQLLNTLDKLPSAPVEVAEDPLAEAMRA